MAQIENETKTGEMLTYNQITDILGGNYNTVKKIVDKFVSENEIKIGEVIRQNRTFKAFELTKTNLAEMQLILKATIRNSKVLFKRIENNRAERIVNISNNTNENDLVKVVENVKKYEAKEILEISQKNNELENKVRLLEANIKDFEIEKEKLKSEKVRIEADLYKAQSDVKLITDKEKTIQEAYFKEKQEKEILIKENKKQTNIINVLAGLLIVLITILATAYIVLSLK